MGENKVIKHYPVEMKLEAIRLFYEEEKTRAEITAFLEIQDRDRVKMWLRQYRREGISAFTKPKGRHHNEQSELERLRMENTLLKNLQSELRKNMPAKRDIGPSSDTRQSSS